MRVLLGCLLIASLKMAVADPLPPLPEPASNNAVAAVKIGNVEYIASFAGISTGLEHSDIHARTYLLNSVAGVWERAPDLPGNVGRLAAVAASVGERIYVFGGYSVDADGNEVSTPWVHAFDPAEKRYTEMQAMPVPVDDAVAVTYLDRYVYLISGWHDFGNVNLVQVLDTETNTWSQATPLPGNALFGHAGGIVSNKLIYCDGVTVQANQGASRSFVASNECFHGSIDDSNFRRIDWRPVDAHPGAPSYRMAAAGVASINAVAFIGGSENPYNFNGIGYDGSPSEPSMDVLLFDLERMQWQQVATSTTATMDHRGLVQFGDAWLTIGGMLRRQKVTAQVISYSLD